MEPKMKPSEVIEKYGWIQGSSGSCERGFCLTGSIDFVFNQRGDSGYADKAEILAKLAGHNESIWSLVQWNDALGRTKEQVIARLKQAGL